MAIKYGFFNSRLVDGVQDRLYNALDITNYFDKLIGNGVFVDPANSLQIVASSGLQVKCKPGKGWIDGFYITNDADLPITLDTADVTLNRIDRIVFRLDKTNRNLSIVVKKGTAATSPTAPVLIRTTEIKEYSLATIYVAKQTTTITQAQITDTRMDSNVCGKVACLIDQIDTSDLYSQWQDAYLRYYEQSTQNFNTWFEEIKDTLSTAIKLQQYESSYTTIADNTTNIPINIANYTWGVDILEVYINGMRIVEPADYTSDANKIILKKAVSKGAVINFVVLKNVDGTGADTVIAQVGKLNTEMAKIQKYIYYATGADDNKKLSTIVQNFYNGTGAFTGISEAAQLKIEVVGDNFTVTEAFEGEGTAVNRYKYFNFGSNTNNSRRCIVDFAKCNRINITLATTDNIIVFNGNEQCIDNCALSVSGGATVSVIVGTRARLNNCDFYVNGTSGVVKGVECCGTFNNCDFSLASAGGNCFVFYGIGSGITRVNGGELYAYTANASAESVCLYVEANKTSNILIADKVSCPIVARSGYNQTNTVKINSGYYSLTSCILGKAAALYSTGEGKTETGTIVFSRVE